VEATCWSATRAYESRDAVVNDELPVMLAGMLDESPGIGGGVLGQGLGAGGGVEQRSSENQDRRLEQGEDSMTSFGKLFL
jgi:hypothetical protein